MNEWHYALQGQQQGPVTAETIRHLQATGVLNTTSLVWCAGMSDWTPLGAVTEDVLPTNFGASAFAASSAPLMAQPEQEHRFEFHGKAGEYFRIWIVNVVLTLLTLGIYAAWAKVRTRRYFYGNTLLDGKPFDFTGNPIAILKGNLIFGGLFVLYTVMLQLYPMVGIGILLVILAIMPWMIQKALRFRAHNMLHRNVRFNFRGTLGDAYGVFLGLLFLIPFTLGLILPYLQFRQKKYMMGNMGWGGAAAEMHGTAGFFYKTFLKYIGILILMAGIMAMVMAGAVAAKMASKKATADQVQTESSDKKPDADSPLESAMEQKVAEEIEKQIQANPDLTEEQKQEMREGAKAGGEIASQMVYIILPFYLFFFVAIIYYQVRTNNYAINTTHWGQLGRLESKVRVRDLLWLYITNGLAVLCSLGLLIPWVLVRMARYRASRTSFIAKGSLDAVAQSFSSSDSAMGDAGADIFDFEIGF